MDYQTLKTELQLPAYSGLSDQAAADALNAVNIAVDRGVIPAYEVINATVVAEWAALSAAEKQRYQTMTGAGQVDSKNANVRAAFQAMFGAGTTTRANLLALQTELRSKATVLGIGTVTALDVSRARAGVW